MTINHRKKTFKFLRQRINPKTSCLIAQCITHCSIMSFYQLLLFCLCLSLQMLSYFCIVSRKPSFSFLFNVRFLNVSSVKLNCFSVCFHTISHLSDYVFIEHVSLRNPPVSNSLNCLCCVEWVSALNC